jgi:hypothetical protein
MVIIKASTGQFTLHALAAINGGTLKRDVSSCMVVILELLLLTNVDTLPEQSRESQVQQSVSLLDK